MGRWFGLVGIVAAKDLPAESSEEKLRLGLRNSIILCNAVNKVQSGVVPPMMPDKRSLLVNPLSRNIFCYKMGTRQSMHSLAPFMNDDMVLGAIQNPVKAP